MRAGRLAAWGLALSSVLGTAPGALASTPRDLFESGNQAYEQGKYEEAAAAYEKVLGYGMADPRVLYNLANAYYKMGRLGPAILNYERALRLDPADRDARDNLELARGFIRDRIQEAEIPYPVKVMKDFLDLLPVDLVGGVFLAVYYATAALGGAWVLSRGSARRKVLGYCAAGAGLLALASGGALLYKVDDSTAPHAIVMEDSVDVLSGPAADNTVLFRVHEGTRLELRGRRDRWYQVSLPNALSGWVPSDALERV